MWKETWKSLTNVLKDWKIQPEKTPILNLRNFTMDEFRCKCCGSLAMSGEFLKRLDRARTIAKIPFVIVSGYRCSKHNQAIGSKPTSSHLSGLAADIACTSDTDRYRIIISCIAVGIKRIGIYRSFLHVDLDPKKSSRCIWYGE